MNRQGQSSMCAAQKLGRDIQTDGERDLHYCPTLKLGHYLGNDFKNSDQSGQQNMMLISLYERWKLFCGFIVRYVRKPILDK